jgi:hypothetical protein
MMMIFLISSIDNSKGAKYREVMKWTLKNIINICNI